MPANVCLPLDHRVLLSGASSSKSISQTLNTSSHTLCSVLPAASLHQLRPATNLQEWGRASSARLASLATQHVGVPRVSAVLFWDRTAGGAARRAPWQRSAARSAAARTPCRRSRTACSAAPRTTSARPQAHPRQHAQPLLAPRLRGRKRIPVCDASKDSASTEQCKRRALQSMSHSMLCRSLDWPAQHNTARYALLRSTEKGDQGTLYALRGTMHSMPCRCSQHVCTRRAQSHEAAQASQPHGRQWRASSYFDQARSETRV